ncbi:hypothetical protein GW17_00062138 [Ensete ventricosum]|nr:hypothetical protein GW17_00062138 [Ensete ventricosum]
MRKTLIHGSRDRCGSARAVASGSGSGRPSKRCLGREAAVEEAAVPFFVDNSEPAKERNRCRRPTTRGCRRSSDSVEVSAPESGDAAGVTRLNVDGGQLQTLQQVQRVLGSGHSVVGTRVRGLERRRGDRADAATIVAGTQVAAVVVARDRTWREPTEEAATLFVVSTIEETEHRLLCFDGCEATIEEIAIVVMSVEKSLIAVSAD